MQQQPSLPAEPVSWGERSNRSALCRDGDVGLTDSSPSTPWFPYHTSRCHLSPWGEPRGHGGPLQHPPSHLWGTWQHLPTCHKGHNGSLGTLTIKPGVVVAPGCSGHTQCSTSTMLQTWSPMPAGVKHKSSLSLGELDHLPGGRQPAVLGQRTRGASGGGDAR